MTSDVRADDADAAASRGGLREAIDHSPAIDLLELMVRARAFEAELVQRFKLGRLRGRLITGRGQEAIPAGVTRATDERDIVCPVHRDLAAHLARGTTFETIAAHYLGCADGLSQGRDGDLHMGEWSRGVFPMISHLPDSWPIAVGLAWAEQLRGGDGVVVAFCGDGATSTGAWHESMNLAAVRRTPNVFVVENNRYAYSTPTELQFRTPELVGRAVAYGMPGVSVDGNDVFQVHEAATEAVEHARRGGGPTLIEAHTMRMDGHAFHDPARYVPPELLERFAARDPIEGAIERLRTAGTFGAELDDLVAELRARAADDAAAAFATAERLAPPDPATLSDGVYARPGEVASSWTS